MERILIGHVDVDSGGIWIGDPCYVIGKDSSSGGDLEWLDVCRKMDDSGYFERQYAEPLGQGVGVAALTAWGDGSYPVYLTKGPDGRNHSITIEFESVLDESDEDADWDDDTDEDEENI